MSSLKNRKKLNINRKSDNELKIKDSSQAALLSKIEPIISSPSLVTKYSYFRQFDKSQNILKSVCKTQLYSKVYIHRCPKKRNCFVQERSKSSVPSPKTSNDSSSFYRNYITINSFNNELCRINSRATKEQNKSLSSTTTKNRLNFDRRGLTSIPKFENQDNIMLLSLQHNLINIFHISGQNSTINSEIETNDVKDIPKLLQCNNTNDGKTTAIQRTKNFPLFEEKEKTVESSQGENLKSAVKNISKFENNLKPDFSSDSSIAQRNQVNKNVTETNFCIQKSQFDSTNYNGIFENLVFLDLYDNQIERISNLDGLKSLTVLLLGKNRISDISGLVSLKNTLRVLDLHGNKIINLNNDINCLQELRFLNLGGNQITEINQKDFNGLVNLTDLNLKRNKIKKLDGFKHLINLQRLSLCHNEIHKIEDMSSVVDANKLNEITIENNPVSLVGDCVSFLVSHLPNLVTLSQMPVTNQVRKAAMTWRKNRELFKNNNNTRPSSALDNIHHRTIISNARANWELLRSQRILNENNLTARSTSNSELLLMCDWNKNLKNYKITENLFTMNQNNVDFQLTKINPVDDKYVLLEYSRTTTNQDDFQLPPIQQNYSNSDLINSSESSLGPNVDSSCDNSEIDNKTNMNNTETDKTTKISAVKNSVKSNQISEQPMEKFEKNDTIIDKTTPTNNSDFTTEETGLNAVEKANQIVKKTEIAKCTVEINAKSTSKDKCDSNASNKTKSKISASSSDTSDKYLRHTAKRITKRITHNIELDQIKQQTRAMSAINQSSYNINNDILLTPVLQKQSKQQCEREREKGGEYLIEICGRYLNVYGSEALRFIDKQWNAGKANDVHTINFSYVNFRSIAMILCRVKLRFTNAINFAFKETHINTLGQINALSELQGITGLMIDPSGNFVSKRNWRSYAIYRLLHWGLKTINGIEINENEIEYAQQEYRSLSDLVLWSIPETTLQPLFKQLRFNETPSSLSSSSSTITTPTISGNNKLSLIQGFYSKDDDESLRIVVSIEALHWREMIIPYQNEHDFREKGMLHLSVIIKNACNAVEKLQKFETLWSNLLLDIVRNALIDYFQIDVYIKYFLSEIFK